jgi:very-short-patch-repair endonuclease
MIVIGKPRSPIEKLIVDALERSAWPSNYAYLSCQFRMLPSRYVVDLFFYETFSSGFFTKGIVVECDGHDFHEKTKEQVRRDKARDRWLQIQGYPVMRFSGSEIYRDSEACCKEIGDLALKQRGRRRLATKQRSNFDLSCIFGSHDQVLKFSDIAKKHQKTEET